MLHIFSYYQTSVNMSLINRIESDVRDAIKSELPVLRSVMPLDLALKLHKLKLLQNEVINSCSCYYFAKKYSSLIIFLTSLMWTDGSCGFILHNPLAYQCMILVQSLFEKRLFQATSNSRAGWSRSCKIALTNFSKMEKLQEQKLASAPDNTMTEYTSVKGDDLSSWSKGKQNIYAVWIYTNVCCVVKTIM